MTRVMQLVHELCRKSIHVTKRDLFYTDVKLFEDQSQVGCGVITRVDECMAVGGQRMVRCG